MTSETYTIQVAGPSTIVVTVTPDNGPTPPDPEPPQPTEQWLTSSITSIGPDDSGPLGVFTAWDKAKGYNYTYSVKDAPPEVTIDNDSGLVSLSSPLEVGQHRFTVVATHRDGSVVEFPLNWSVDGRVVVKTYDPHDTRFGTPSGGNWTNVLLAMQQAMVADQATYGEELLRCVIPLRSGTTYDYTNNHWTRGVQYVDVVSTGEEKARIRCIQTGPAIYDNGPLNVGHCGALHNQGMLKQSMARIDNAACGDSTVKLLDPADASKIKSGRWHIVLGNTQQLGGYPPSSTYHDYVRVVSTDSDGTIHLDRRLKWDYRKDWWEKNDDTSLGVARIAPFDLDVGQGTPTLPSARCTLRGRWQNIEMLPNPNGDRITYVEGHVLSHFDRCIVPNHQPSMSAHTHLEDCEYSSNNEADKIMETLTYVNQKCALGEPEFGGATGVHHLIMRDSLFPAMSISPRQITSIRTVHDCTGNSNIGKPFTIAHNGPALLYRFIGSTFKGANTSWTWGCNPNSSTQCRIGDAGVTCANNVLSIPDNFGSYEHWLSTAHPKAVLSKNGRPPHKDNYGYIESVSSDEHHLLLTLKWLKGAAPANGDVLYADGRDFGELLVDNGCKFTNGITWTSPGFSKQTVPSYPGDSYDWPEGLPQ